MEGEKPAIRSAPATPELKKFVQSLVERAEGLKTGRVDPREDNMLKITSEGRKAALDLRLMMPSLPDDPQSKVNLAVENIYRIWEATKDDRLTQLVFCDLSTPQDKGFSVYRDMAEKLVNDSASRQAEIAFIQDYDADNAKLALFRSVRAGKVRILFGSTQKMGSGTNVQERLVALASPRCSVAARRRGATRRPHLAAGQPKSRRADLPLRHRRLVSTPICGRRWRPRPNSSPR